MDQRAGGDGRGALAASGAAAVLAAADGERFSQALSAGGTVTLVVSPSLGRAVMLARDVPAAPPGKVYALWVRDPAGALAPAGLVAAPGLAPVLVEAPCAKLRGFGLTLEPEGGSPQPTGTPVGFLSLTV